MATLEQDTEPNILNPILENGPANPLFQGEIVVGEVHVNLVAASAHSEEIRERSVRVENYGTLRRPSATEGERPPERQRRPSASSVSERPPERRSRRTSTSVVCYCLMSAPIFLAFLLSVLSTGIFAEGIENRDNSHCTCFLLNCRGARASWECWLVLTGGSVVCIVTLLLLVSICARMCFRIRMCCYCVMLELFVLLILAAFALIAATNLTLGIRIVPESCKKEKCDSLWINLLEIAEITSWGSFALLALATVMWILCGITICCTTSRRVERLQPRERDPLIVQ